MLKHKTTRLLSVLGLVVALILTLFASAKPAFAIDYFVINGVTCDIASNTILISGSQGSAGNVGADHVVINGTDYGLFEFFSSQVGAVSIAIDVTAFAGVTMSKGTTVVVSAIANFAAASSASTTCGSTPANVPGLYLGPAVPPGFVLHEIVCEVPITNLPGGAAMTTRVLHKGQTWYVNPIASQDAKGRWWTEVFVSGPVNGFIPTYCVWGVEHGSSDGIDRSGQKGSTSPTLSTQGGGGPSVGTGTGTTPSGVVKVAPGSKYRLIIITPANTASAQAEINALIAQGFHIFITQKIGTNTYVTLKK